MKLGIAAYYSLMPNCLGYCGEADFAKVLRGYLDGKRSENELKTAIRRFKGNYPYLKTIARANGIKNPFDPRVLHAFWIGNKLLENVKREGVVRLIRSFVKNAGMDRKRAEKKIAGLPKGILLHHSFNSLYLNFVGNKVQRSVKNFDKCRISWGKVVKVGGKHAIVEYEPIIMRRGRFVLGKRIKRRFLRSTHGIIPELNIKVGGIVSMHWGLVVQKLSKRRAGLLKKYTSKNILVLNRSGR